MSDIIVVLAFALVGFWVTAKIASHWPKEESNV